MLLEERLFQNKEEIAQINGLLVISHQGLPGGIVALVGTFDQDTIAGQCLINEIQSKSIHRPRMKKNLCSDKDINNRVDRHVDDPRPAQPARIQQGFTQ